MWASTPRARKATTVSNPIDPAPTTSAVLPGCTVARRTPCQAMASGSTSAASVSRAPAAMGYTRCGSTSTNSARPPFTATP
jgi:hypothetical protein